MKKAVFVLALIFVVGFSLDIPFFKNIGTGLGLENRQASNYLIEAIKDDNFRDAETQLQNGASVNYVNYEDKRRTPLHYFVYYGKNPQILELLLSYDPDVNKWDEKGKTPLDYCYMWNNDEPTSSPDFIDKLVARGAVRGNVIREEYRSKSLPFP